jgi:signal peptidase I
MKKRIFLFCAALASIALLGGCAATAFYMPTASMEPTIHQGDHLLVLKRPLMGKVQRGDFLVFQYPVEPNQIFIKRVVGMPGDHIQFANKQLILNGKPTAEPYVEHRTSYTDRFRDDFPSEPNVRLPETAIRMLERNTRAGEVIVPPDSYFVLGDNRDNSLDSRYWGFVPAANIYGVAVYIYSGHPGPLHRAAPQ